MSTEKRNGTPDANQLMQKLNISREEPSDENVNLGSLMSSIRQDSDDTIFVPELENSSEYLLPEKTVEVKPEPTEPGKKEEVPQASDKKKKRKKKKKNPLKGILIALVLVAAAGYGIYRFVDASPKKVDRSILNNVYVAGVDVSGMFQSQAIAAVNASLNQGLYTEPVVIYLPNQTVTISPNDSNVFLDVKAAVEAAYAYGHTSYNAKEEAQAASRGESYTLDLVPYLSLNESEIRRIVTEATNDCVGEYLSSGYRLEGNAPLLEPENFDITAPCQTLVLNKGIPGTGIDPDMLYQRVLEAYRTGNFTVDASSPDTQRMPEPLDLDLIYRILTVSANDAQVDDTAVTLIPGSYGYSFNLEAARSAVEEAPYGEDIRVPMQYVAPNVKIGNVYFQNELGSCEIACDAAALPKVIAACGKINGSIVKPGMRFSMLTSLGTLVTPATCQNDPSGDEGFCIVGTALYQAALKAEVGVQEAAHHNYFPTYCEKGMDAFITTNNGVQFSNNTGSPIIVLSETTASGVRVRIMGTETRDYTTSLTSEITMEQDFRVEERREAQDSGYKNGQVIQTGFKPCAVAVRLIKVNSSTGETISNNIVRTVHYVGRPQIIARID